jgi:hypothetical protein
MPPGSGEGRRLITELGVLDDPKIALVIGKNPGFHGGPVARRETDNRLRQRYLNPMLDPEPERD